MKERFSISTREGCLRILAVLLAAILVCSLFAQLISSDGGKIKIESIQIDPRGAELSGDLYYPAGTTDEDNYPAVILAPGAGVTKENMRGFAEELARRGYVVFNLNPYGSGLSETPVYNENDMGILEYNIFATPLGVLDAVNYLRTVEFVDATRIGLSGHSQGSRRTGYAGLMDCGYYSFNDCLLIMLNENFGVQISEADLTADADAVAERELSAEQFESYCLFKDELKGGYDCMVKALCLIGSTAQFVNPTATVDVAGHEVTRTCKVNECIINGEFDYGYLSFNNDPATKESWYIDAETDIVNGGYYALDDTTGTSKLIGHFREDTIGSNSELKAAIDNRSLRIVMTTHETHSKNFFSNQTTAMVIDYFNQVLDNNSESGTTTAGEMVFMWRELFNLIAMLAMIAMILPIVGLLRLNGKYAAAISRIPSAEMAAPKKSSGIVVLVLTVALGFLSVYWLNANKSLINFSGGAAFPMMITAWTTPKLCVWLAAATLVVMLVYLALTREFKQFGTFVKGNFTIGFGGILRGIGAACGFIAVAYCALSVAEYFFQQDYRFWMTAFGQLKANHWMYVASYGLLLLPWFIILSFGMNYLSDRVLGGKWDVPITVVVNSAGIWLCCLVNCVMAYCGLKTDDLFSSFILSYGALLLVPINCFVMRKSYKMTRNIWFGAVACSLLGAWLIVSISGMNGSYIPTTWMSSFLGA